MSTKRQVKRELREILARIIENEIALGTATLVAPTEKDIERAEEAIQEIADEVRRYRHAPR